MQVITRCSIELQGLLGCKVDVANQKGLRQGVRDRVLAEAVPLWDNPADERRCPLGKDLPYEAETIKSARGRVRVVPARRFLLRHLYSID